MSFFYKQKQKLKKEKKTKQHKKQTNKQTNKHTNKQKQNKTKQTNNFDLYVTVNWQYGLNLHFT